MIRLPNTGTYSLELITAQNGATVVVCYSDATATAYTGGIQTTTVSSATTTVICSTPAASTVRDIDEINIKNTFAGSHTITVQVDANATNVPVIVAVLLTDESLNYTHGSGWQCKDASGNTKVNSFGFVMTSAQLAALISDETGSGLLVFNNAPALTSPTLTTPVLGTPSSGNLANCTGYVGTSALVTTGALNSGSITSGFGSIDIGTDTLAAGNTTITGTLSATTGAAVGGATAGTGGIAFPATAVAVADVNTLDDYEEGTWTPIDSSGAALSFTGVTGTYTKVGRQVTVLAELTYPSTASSASAVIGGLPFASSGSGCGINGAIRYTTVAATSVTFVSGGTSSSTVTLLRPGSNTTNVQMTLGTLLFSAVYFV